MIEPAGSATSDRPATVRTASAVVDRGRTAILVRWHDVVPEAIQPVELRYSARRVPGKDYVKVSPPTISGSAGISEEVKAWRALSTALREQLGLRLEPRTVPDDVLVIDRIALPAYD